MRPLPGSVDLLVAAGRAVGHGAAPVDLRLSAGRAPAVVGPNGSGASTLLRTLVGLLEPLAGTVTLVGAVRAAWSLLLAAAVLVQRGRRRAIAGRAAARRAGPGRCDGTGSPGEPHQ